MKKLLVLGIFVSLVSCATQSNKVASPSQQAAPEVAPVSEKKQENIPAIELGEITEVTVEQVFELKISDRALLIDTRPPVFFAMGHIDGAESIALKNFEKTFPPKEALVKSAASSGKVIIIYCADEKCPDSYLMAKRLSEMGLDVSVFKGGWELWKQSGLAEM